MAPAGIFTACSAEMHGFRNETPRAPCQSDRGFAGWSINAEDSIFPSGSVTWWLYHGCGGQSDAGSVALEFDSLTSPFGSKNVYGPSFRQRKQTPVKA